MLNHTILNQLPLAIGLKDLDSNYIGGNLQLARHMGYASEKQIKGLTDYDICCPMVALAEQFIRQDQKVLKYGEQSHLDIGYYPNGDFQIHYSTKKTFEKDNKVAGTVFTCQEIKHAGFYTVYKDLLRSKKPGFYSIDDQPSGFKLSSREKQTLFYLLRGFCARETAGKLKISRKTVEYHISQLKLKLNCNSKTDLIEAAMALGLFFNIPLGIFPGL